MPVALLLPELAKDGSAEDGSGDAATAMKK
jgi:hypothetical protein